MIHPVNMPVFMTARPSVYDSDSPSNNNLFDNNVDYFELARGPTYGADGRRMREDGAPATPTTPNTLWSDAVRRSFVRALNDQEERRRTSPSPLPPPAIANVDDATDEGVSDDAWKFSKLLMYGDDTKKPLELKWVDLKAKENAKLHHTSDFDLVQRSAGRRLLVRRGQEFRVLLNFFRTCDLSIDHLELVFELGPYPAESKGTKAILNLSQPDTGFGGWSAKIDSLSGSRLDLRITTPSSAVIGRWTMKVVTSRKTPDGRLVENVCPIDGIYLLFNPWCKGDLVHMENEEDLDEYVLNDMGKIWRGSHNSTQSTVWSFGQFEEGILECCMLLLDDARIPKPLRASPVYVCRAISQIVNSKDDNGVVAGKWGEDFRGGTPPTQWTGSAQILRQYASSNRPVRWGQCWVFAGVVTTVLRCLGIPSRVVTNYSSAHDTDSSCTVDIHFSTDTGKILKKMNMDSIWTFHVWNDCWMERPDLPPGYGGWQAVDSTPQEKSEGLYRVGPASVRAIKEGEVAFAYDTAFLFAEVNADKYYWLADYRGRLKLNDVTHNEVGRFMLTKRPGKKLLAEDEDRLDVTIDYKHPEMTYAERQSVMNALLMGHSKVVTSFQDYIDQPKDVIFTLDLNRSVKLGEDLQTIIYLDNTTRDETTVKLSIRVNTALYTGQLGPKVKGDIQLVKLPPRKVTKVTTAVTAYEYTPKLLSLSSFMVSVVGHVLDSGQIFATTDDCRLEKPEVDIEVVGEPAFLEPFTVNLRVFNPLPATLSNCTFMVEGPGLVFTREYVCEDAQPRGLASVALEVKPWRAGERTLVVRFNSTELSDVQGSRSIYVRDRNYESSY